jgi:hypothetical protein
MKEITADPKLVAYCGLYCGACGSYLKGRCPGCAENEKAGWCKIRVCCMENHTPTCAACDQFADVADCKKYHNLMSQVIGFVLRSNREACIDRIREIGPEAFADEMAQKRTPTIKRPWF